MIASLSIPWGFNKGDEDLGGYHLVWPRDLVETAGGFLAAGAHADALRVLRYLSPPRKPTATGRRTCGWTGARTGAASRWTRPLSRSCCVDLLRREAPECWETCSAGGRWCGAPPAFSSATVRSPSRIAGRKTPATRRSRSPSRSPRYSPPPTWPTRSARRPSPDICARLADTWNDNIERWTYSTDADLARQIGVDGYYVRIAPPDDGRRGVAAAGFRADQEPPPVRARAPRRRHRQPGCARAGALRPARARRSAHTQHHQSDRRAAEGRDCRKARAGIATTAMATASMTTVPLRWHRHRPGLAAARRRTRPLRTGRRPSAKSPSALCA